MRRRLAATLVAAAALAPLAGGAAPAAAAGAVRREAVVRLWPDEGRVEAEDRIDLAAAGGSGAVALRLATGLAVRAAEVDGRPAAVEPGGEGVWRVRVPDGAAGRTLRVSYGGRLPDAGSGEPPFLAPEGGFLPAGTGWLPELLGEGGGSGAAAFGLTLEVPEPHRAVADGRLVEEAGGAGSYRARFAYEGATAGAPSAFVGPYRLAERRDGDVVLRTYFHEGEGDLAGLYLDRTSQYLRLLEGRIGRYPYADFSVVAAPLPVGYGFPGVAYVSRRILRLPFMQAGSLAHEIAHSWWGNAVGVAYGEGNWAEGLTTYMADHALAEARGAAEAREMRLGWLRDFGALPPGRDVPLAAFATKEHDASQVVGYGKAAFVFHMLRRRAGEDGFDGAVRRLYRDHRSGVASWADVRRAFEAAAGRDLGAFFARWVRHPGAPRLHLADARSRPAAGGAGHEVGLTLRQDEPAYPLLVPVEVGTDAGVERAEVELGGAEAAAVLRVGSRPRWVAVDPDHDVFRHLAPGEAPPILRDVTLSGDAAALVAVGDDAREPAREVAGRIVARLLDAGAADDAGDAGTAPLLVVGLAPAVAAALAERDLPPAPPSLAGRGTGRAWTARRAGGGAPLLVVEAEDAAALEALARPLPHYRRDSYLVFEGGTVVDRGAWPAGDNPLRRRLD